MSSIWYSSWNLVGIQQQFSKLGNGIWLWEGLPRVWLHTSSVSVIQGPGMAWVFESYPYAYIEPVLSQRSFHPMWWGVNFNFKKEILLTYTAGRSRLMDSLHVIQSYQIVSHFTQIMCVAEGLQVVSLCFMFSIPTVVACIWISDRKTEFVYHFPIEE